MSQHEPVKPRRARIPKTQNPYMSDRDLAERYHNSRATIWRWVKDGKFPPPIKLSPQCSRWRLEDALEWERSR